MTNDLDSIKSNPRVLQLYHQYVKSLKKTGDKYTGLCPLHREKSPSFTVFPDMRFQCFGCGKADSIIGLVQLMDGVDFKTALDKVKETVGDARWSRDKEVVERTFKPVSEPKTYKTLTLDQWRKLEDNLERSQVAKDWLKRERGIEYETAKKLRFGFIQSIGKLAGEAGADIADGGWIAFPSLEGDKVLSVKYRSLVRKKPGGFARQPGMATALFNSETVDPFEGVFVTEGEFDAAVLEQAGFRAVSLPNATHKLTPAQKDKLMEASFVVLAGDSDAAGSGAMDRLWRELPNRVYKLTWPEGIKDANEAYLKNRDGFVQLMDDLVRKAKSQPMPDIHSIQEVMRNGEDRTLADREDRLRFPWPDVDKMAVLLPGSLLGVIATQTGQGKSSFVTQFTLDGARRYNETVVNWQCELSPAEMSVLVAAQVLRKNRNFLTKEDMQEAARQLDGVEYYVGNSPNAIGIMEVLDIMEAAIRRLGATIAVLDNLHYYTTGIDDEVRVQAAAMKRIKQIAVSLGCKFVVVFQPRKANQQTKGKKTHITDVRGSASAGDTSDAILAIHRNIAKETEGEGLKDIYEEKTLVEFLKTRAKGVGKSSAYLHFFGEFGSFVQLDTVHEEVGE